MKIRFFSSISSTLLVFSLLSSIALVSCKKKCDLPPDSVSGDVVPNAIVKERSVGSNRVIKGESQPGTYQVSFDGGITYGQIDFTKYFLLAQPMVVTCHTSVEKTVTIDKPKKRVEYQVTVTECPSCDDKYDISNWVLVPKFPDNFNVIYRKRIVEKED